MGLVTSASFPSVCCRSLEVHRRVAKAVTEGKKSSHAAVRHDKSSLLSVLQGKTQSDVKGQVNSTRSHLPGVEASGDRSHTVQQSDDVSQENPGGVSGEGRISLVSQEFSSHGTRGIRFGRLLSDSLEHQVVATPCKLAKMSSVTWQLIATRRLYSTTTMIRHVHCIWSTKIRYNMLDARMTVNSSHVLSITVDD